MTNIHVNGSKEFGRSWDQGGVTLTASEVSNITQLGRSEDDAERKPSMLG